MNLISSVLLAGFMALIVLGVWHEMRVMGRLRRAGLAASRHRRRLNRRLLGLLCLSASVAVLTNTWFFERHVANPFFRLSWIGMAFVFVILAVWLAIRDLGETGRMAQEEAQRVVVESLATLQEEIAKAKQEKSGREGHTGPTRDQHGHGHSRSRSRKPRPARRRTN